MTWGELLNYADELGIREDHIINFNIEPDRPYFVVNSVDEADTTWSIL